MSSITSGAVSGEERQAYAKLEALKDIRSKTLSLEKLRQRLFHDVDSVEGENHCLKEYKKELDLLLQEKMAHVAELRQIHADINAMETVIKQSEEARRTALDSARRILDDYSPLKHDVDIMRTELLGLEKLPDLAPEDKDRLSEIGVGEKPKQLNLLEGHPAWHHPGSGDPRMDAVDKGNPFFFGRPGTGPHPFLAAAAAQHSAMGLGPLGLGAKAEQLRTTLSAQAGGPPVPPPFRQQPPPMKNCMSCHQQIHRNAPICPLCKAKSRSRNPKKPKKKD